MSPKTKPLSLDEQRSRLERRANVIRSRLLRTIDALDNRRHQVQEIGHHAKRLAKPVGVSVLGILAVAAGTTVAIRVLVGRRRERSFTNSARFALSKALAPLRQPARPPFWQEALRKVALAAIGVVAAELIKRGAHGLLAEGRSFASPALRAAPAAALLAPHVEEK